jgi:hypothetical protein
MGPRSHGATGKGEGETSYVAKDRSTAQKVHDSESDRRVKEKLNRITKHCTKGMVV